MKVKNDLLTFIGNISIFKDTNPKTVKKITEHLQEKKLFKNETLYLQSEIVKDVFIIKEGKVEIFKISDEGKKLTVKIRKKGDIFCLGNIFSDKAIHNCQAKQDSLLYSIPSRVFKRLCEEDHNLLDNVILALVKNIVEYSSILERVKLMDGEACISSLLLAIQKNRVVRATQEEIADMSGLCRETVSRLLKNLKEKGCVETHKGSIIIKNLEQLQQLCS